MPFEVKILDEEKYPVIMLLDTFNNCEAEIYSFGALLNSFSIATANGKINVVDGYESSEDAVKNISAAFKSAKLSPFVCRMKEGKFSFEGKEYCIEKFYSNKHALHGVIYDMPYTIAETVADNKNAAVTLQVKYDGSDAGFPFPYQITVQWKLEIKNKLTATTIITHNNSSAIPIADGWHPYFKMDVPIDECTIEFDSDMQLEFDDELLPTGKLKNYAVFLEKTSLKNIELDNSFALDPLIDNPHCILKGRALRLTIAPDKSYPYLQIYTPPHRESIAIENLSSAPNSFNNGIGLVVAKPGEKYTFKTSYQLETI